MECFYLVKQIIQFTFSATQPFLILLSVYTRIVNRLMQFLQCSLQEHNTMKSHQKNAITITFFKPLLIGI